MAILIKVETLNHSQAHETPWHCHDVGQLYWLQRGLVIIETDEAQWPITPGSVGWLPKKNHHKASVLASAQGVILHITDYHDVSFPQEAGIYSMNDFLSSLVKRSTCLDGAHYSSDYLTHFIALLGYELKTLKELPLGLPLPSDRRARNIADELLKAPANNLSQEQLAKQWGLSVRTLSRIFIKQTGLTFSQWRQQAKVIVSLKWLLQGLAISEVAERSGYSNVSAYIKVFSQRFGKTPRKFQPKVR